MKTNTDPLIAELARVTCEEVYDEAQDVPRCLGCDDVLYDFTKFLTDPETGELEPTDWCCDCYPEPGHPVLVRTPDDEVERIAQDMRDNAGLFPNVAMAWSAEQELRAIYKREAKFPDDDVPF